MLLEHTRHRSHLNFFVHIKLLLLLVILSLNLIPILSLLLLLTPYPKIDVLKAITADKLYVMIQSYQESII
ncbi:Uncharacterised protein [Orientia tsutsugamushi]|uniref:Uncharacterized protein n=1 Tax=Orientia tsutsugamushi TaxID=784 RepID=A0A2U3RP13_ORITS|nr:hypothetical protein OTSKARP_0814 [Orientia tsutsugamushi str. Karp]SPR14975.1 Uncharacterised protein [Orientia tsutsugamushi]